MPPQRVLGVLVAVESWSEWNRTVTRVRCINGEKFDVGSMAREQELIDQLRQAGFQNVETIRLIPGEQFFAFKVLAGGKPEITRD